MPTQPSSRLSAPTPPLGLSINSTACAHPDWPSPEGATSILQAPHNASQWIFRAADEALLNFVTQQRPRQTSLTQMARAQLDTLSNAQLQTVSAMLRDFAYDQHDWKALQPATLSAFSLASETLAQEHAATLNNPPAPPENPPGLAADDPAKRRKRSKKAKRAIEQPVAPDGQTNTPPAPHSSLGRTSATQFTPVGPYQIDQPATEANQALDPHEVLARFLALQPESGNENQRRRAIHKALHQTGTAEIGILVSRSNLHVRRFNPLPAGKSRQRSLLLVPDVFCRLAEGLGPMNTLVVKDMLQTTQTLAMPASDAQALRFRMTLVCGLFGLLHRLHSHRVANGQASNWPEHGQGLLHFNFMHIVTGLGEIPELAILLQDAFCECLLDAGKQLREDSDLQTVWAGSETINRRTGERARQLARSPEFLSIALANKDRFALLVSTLSIVMAHSKLIQTDPLRKQLAANILEIFAKTLLTELSPFAPRSEPTK